MSYELWQHLNSLTINSQSCISTKRDDNLLCTATFTVLHAFIVEIVTRFSSVNFFLIYTTFSGYVVNIIWIYPWRSRLTRTWWWQTFRASTRYRCTWCWTCWASECVNYSTRWEVLTACLRKLFITRCKMNSMFIFVNFFRNLVALFFMIIIPNGNFTKRLSFLDTFLISCGNIFNFTVFTWVKSFVMNDVYFIRYPLEMKQNWFIFNYLCL